MVTSRQCTVWTADSYMDTNVSLVFTGMLPVHSESIIILSVTQLCQIILCR